MSSGPTNRAGPRFHIRAAHARLCSWPVASTSRGSAEAAAAAFGRRLRRFPAMTTASIRRSVGVTRERAHERPPRAPALCHLDTFIKRSDRKARDSDYGLNFSVWTSDGTARAGSTQLQAGTIAGGTVSAT